MNVMESLYFQLADGRPARGQIVFDDEPSSMNPREDEATGAFLYTQDREWLSPDKFESAPPELADIIDSCSDRGEGVRVGLVQRWARIFKPTDVFYVGALWRGGNRGELSMGDPDNSDDYYNGIVVVTRSTVRHTHGDFPITPYEAEQLARFEVKRYSAWAAGETYGWVVEAPAFPGADIDSDPELLESCWGFIGDDEFPYMRDCIREALPEGYFEISKAEYDQLCASQERTATGTGWPR